MGFTNTFGNNPIRPANPSYLNLSISANTTLVWPIESAEGTNPVAAQIDVTATASSLTLTMPDARQSATGVATLIQNVGSNSLTLNDNGGNAIVTLNSGIAWIIALTGNTTAAGTWRATQLGATTSNAQASTLAGAGLAASGSTLQLSETTTKLSANTTLDSTYRAKLVVWTGGAGTLTLDTLANLGTGWTCDVMNEGTATLTIATSSSQTINGASTLAITANSAASIVAGSSDFNTRSVSGTANNYYSTATSIALTGTSINFSAVQVQNQLVRVTGALTANYTASFPNGTTGEWIFFNQTTGAFTLTVNTTASAVTGTATGTQTSTTLQDTSQAWTVNQFVNAVVTITGGTGNGQSRTILSNTGNTLTVVAWTSTPDATSTYSIAYASVIVPQNVPVLIDSDGKSIFLVSGQAPYWKTVSANYTAIHGDKLLCDTTSAAFTVTLPANPVVGTEVKVADGTANFATNNLTINPNGGTINGISGNETLSTNGASVTVAAISSAAWRLV